jgi:hypothetical protein
MMFGNYISASIIYIGISKAEKVIYMNDLSYFSTSYYAHIEDPFRFVYRY